jgi:hypothetical protein
MKKITVLLLTIAMLLSCAGCAKIEPVTVETFRTTMEGAGFEVTDCSNEVDSESVDAIFTAEKDGYYIDLWCFKDEATAQSFYNSLKEDMEDMGGNYTNISAQEFSKYEATTATAYAFAAWAGTTVLNAECSKADKEVVRSAIELLGYI